MNDLVCYEGLGVSGVLISQRVYEECVVSNIIS